MCFKIDYYLLAHIYVVNNQSFIFEKFQCWPSGFLSPNESKLWKGAKQVKKVCMVWRNIFWHKRRLLCNLWIAAWGQYGMSINLIFMSNKIRNVQMLFRPYNLYLNLMDYLRDCGIGSYTFVLILLKENAEQTEKLMPRKILKSFFFLNATNYLKIDFHLRV